MAGGRVDFSAKGASDLAALAKALKAAGNGGLRKELYAGLQRGTGTMRERAKANALADLPKGGGRGVVSYNKATGARMKKLKKKGFANRGGKATRVESLAQRVAGARFTVKSRTTANGAGLTIKAEPTKGRAADLSRIDEGINRHPLYGNKKRWYPQKVTPGWFSNAAEQHALVTRVSLLQTIDEVAKKLAAS